MLAAQVSLVAPLVIGLLLTGAGTAATLQARFAATDLAPALAGVVVALTLRPDPMRTLQRLDPEHGQASPRPRGMRARVRGSLDTVRGDPAARLAVLAILTAQAVMVTVMTMTPVHLDHHGEGITIIGLVAFLAVGALGQGSTGLVMLALLLLGGPVMALLGFAGLNLLALLLMIPLALLTVRTRLPR